MLVKLSLLNLFFAVTVDSASELAELVSVVDSVDENNASELICSVAVVVVVVVAAAAVIVVSTG